MPNQPSENSPELPKQAPDQAIEQTDIVDTEQLANAILTGCASGANISDHLANLGTLKPDQRETLQRHIGTLLAEHSSMLTEPQHWMTLQKVGRDVYIAILRHASEHAGGMNKLTIGTKLADILRRETDNSKKIESLDEAESILINAIDETDEMNEGPEKMRALSSAYYTHSFISFGKAEMTGAGQEEERRNLIDDSLTRLDISKRCAEQAGDHEGAAQSEIRWCAVHIDMNIGNMADLVPKLDALAKKLQGSASTWGNRFLNNALTRRVEASAKCSHPEWESFYRETMERPGFEQQHGGAENLKKWKEKNCPAALRKEEGLE